MSKVFKFLTANPVQYLSPIVKGQYHIAGNPIFEVFYADFSGSPSYEF